MAIFVLSTVDVVVNTNKDLSPYVRSVSVEFECSEQDATAMQGGGNADDVLFYACRAGLKSWTVTLELNQDFAVTTGVDAILQPLWGTSTDIALIPVNTDLSTSNPSYSGDCVLLSYNPIAGAVGDLATCTATFKGSGELARSTS